MITIRRSTTGRSYFVSCKLCKWYDVRCLSSDDADAAKRKHAISKRHLDEVRTRELVDRILAPIWSP